MKSIAKAILKLFGWSVVGEYDDSLKNCIIVIAPHTSNWDFIWGVLARSVYQVRVKYLIKDSFFKPGIAWFFNWTGGIPVNRKKKTDLTERLVKMLDSGEEIKVAFTPEGTRKRVDRWRSGFYWVAMETKLPIVMHYMDYKRKQVVMGEPFWPSGDWEKDKPVFEAFYADVTAHTIENFNHSF